MQTQISETPGAAKKKRGAAPDADDVLRLDLVRPSIAELVALYKKKVDTATAYKDGIQAIAAKGGLNKKALKIWIEAKANDELGERHAYFKQLELLFEEL